MGPIRDVTHAAQAMEACLLRQLIETSGAFRGSSGTAGGQIHAQMFVEALADAVEKGGGIGLARLIEDSLPATGTDEMTQTNGEATTNEASALNTYRNRVDLPVSNRPRAKGDWP
jgi:glycine/D-amino acid oxidase-like deaminating enzyme